MAGGALTKPLAGRLRRSVAGLPRNVVLLGVTSFFADVSTEMIYPIVPIFLTTTLGAPVAAVGLIEGVAESTASLMKLVSGWLSDRLGRRLPLVISGYGLAAAGKLVLAAAYAWPVVLLARFIDRFGKGMRGSPRDALIADSTPAALRGRAFGLHRSMDTAGAVVGPLLGLALVALLDERLRLVFLIAAVPGFLSIASLLPGIEDVTRRSPGAIWAMWSSTDATRAGCQRWIVHAVRANAERATIRRIDIRSFSAGRKREAMRSGLL